MGFHIITIVEYEILNHPLDHPSCSHDWTPSQGTKSCASSKRCKFQGVKGSGHEDSGPGLSVHGLGFRG